MSISSFKINVYKFILTSSSGVVKNLNISVEKIDPVHTMFIKFPQFMIIIQRPLKPFRSHTCQDGRQKVSGYANSPESYFIGSP
jgi:hypothetical protein